LPPVTEDREISQTAASNAAGKPSDGGGFGEQQCIVDRIDDSGKRSSAFSAFEPVAFKAALVDNWGAAPRERELRIAVRARDHLGVRCFW